MQKVRTPRDKKYLAYVRSLKCCKCGRNINVVAHHVFTGGTGIKCSDYFTLPLCHDLCHNRVHNIGFKSFWGDINPMTLIDRYRGQYEKECN